MAAGKGCDFMSVAAKRHRAPAPATRARVIIEEEAARRVGAKTKLGAWAFGNEFGGGTSDGCQEPVRTAFTGDELDAPFAVVLQ